MKFRITKRRAQARRAVAVRAAIENLEGRAMFSTTVPFTGTTYSQNFDGLISTGSVTPGGSPADLSLATYSAPGTLDGWAFTTSGTLRFSANDGGLNTGSVYSYGSVGSTDRALGTLASGTNISKEGVTLVNNTANTISSFTITFDGEMWRRGDSAANTMTFDYKVGGAIADASGFTAVPQLNFVAPSTATPNSASRDGNAAAFRTAGKTFTITPRRFLGSRADARRTLERCQRRRQRRRSGNRQLQPLCAAGGCARHVQR